MKEITWKDTPKPLNLFTVRNATMRDLETKKIIQYYSANTKISVVQKTQVGDTTYYRTASAKERSLNWAFEASAFGLPNEKAPSVPLSSFHTIAPYLEKVAPALDTKQKSVKKNDIVSSKDGEKKRRNLFVKIIKRIKFHNKNLKNN